LPFAIDFDSSSNVYVTDLSNNRIEVFTPVNQDKISSNDNINLKNSGNTTTQSQAGISGQF
jgi:hypothetical protein